MTRSAYERIIQQILAKMGRAEIDPRHVEGYIRLEHRTLDSLSFQRFHSEVQVAVACIDEGGTKEAEANAQSFGL